MGSTTAALPGVTTEIAGERNAAPPLHSRQFWLFRALPLYLLLAIVLLASMSALVVLACGAPSWAAAIAAALVLVGGLLPVRGKTVAGRLVEKVAAHREKFGAKSTIVHHRPFDVPLPDGGSYGMRWDGSKLITMVRIDGQPSSVTLLNPSGFSSGEMVPLPEIARCLDQFDIGIDSIDVISKGSRTSDAGPVARLYEQILGPLPAVAHRTVWVVLRFDPLSNTDAVDRRGGGSTGTLRSAIIATRRVTNRLAARDLSVSVLSAAEMTAAVGHLTHNATLDELVETPHSVEHDGIHYSTYQMTPEALGPRGLAEVWASSSLATTVTLRLDRAPTRMVRASAETATLSVTAMVRFDTRHRPAEVNIPGLVAVPRKQRQLFLHSLPIGTQGPPPPLESYFGTAGSLTALFTPIAGCGQLVGADASGQGVALPLVGHHVRRVEITGSLLVAKQVILRAIALGAAVVVHTNRHEEWRPMVAHVDAPQSLTLASWSAGSQQASVYRAATVFVYDGIAPSGHHSDATVMVLRPETDGSTENFAPDITITEESDTANLVTVRTEEGSATVYMVATPAEMNYLAQPVLASA